ncbi:MAG: glycerophosphodiester phosphodiesterase [Ignavibacteriae bacterium]|nr:glycerophosphodiester phosphodiesterase [Ignavibacteriota bacterium]
MNNKIVLILLILLIASGCDYQVSLVNPQFTDTSVLEGTNEIPINTRKLLEGIYQVTVGKEKFGQQLVLKWNRGKLSIYGSKLGIYFILDGGIRDSTLFFEGKWRYALNTETGLVRLTYDLSENSLKLVGHYGNELSSLDKNFELTYIRPFSAEVTNKDFYILAHRGGGRNSDYVGASENSLEILPFAEYFGANGVEIDVKLSKDNIPFIYHDETINLRLTSDSPIWGDIEKFTYKQLSTFVILKNGEHIPTLIETLNYILDETELKIVWLDMKSEKNTMPYVISIQQEILSKAKANGRDLEIVIGLPTEEKRDLFLQQNDFKNITSLCELSLDDTRNTNSSIWAPRWTLGTQLSSVEQMHNEGRKVFTWTLDQAEFISEFIEYSNFDGILTNYPTLVSYYHYAR